VTCLSMDGDFIIAGGSEGTVTIWRRRFGKVSTQFSESSSSSSNTTLVELAPELLSREHRAHSIVRLVVTPSGRSLVSAALSGGGEGDVRLWMIPPAPGSISSSVRTGTKVANVVSNAIATAAIESKIKWAEARGYTSPSPTSISLAPVQAPLSFLGNPNPQPTPITVQCKVLRGHTSRITGLSMDNCVLISLSLDGAMKVWDLQEPHIGGMLFTARLPDAREASSLSCSGTDVAIGSVDGHVFVFSFGSVKQIQQVSSVTKEVATAPVTSSLDKVQMGALTSHDRNRDIRALNADAEGGWTRLDLGGGDINGDLTPYELQQLYDAL
jgi:WD40 repeat protein